MYFRITVAPQVLLHVLFEHAAGYALFAVKEVEEIGMLLPQVTYPAWPQVPDCVTENAWRPL